MTRPEADQILSQIIDALVQSPVLVLFHEGACLRADVRGARIIERFEGDYRVTVDFAGPSETWDLHDPTTKVRPARP